MSKRQETRPTYIYLLVDCRPDVLASGWPCGEPFYCGKTVQKLSYRLVDHLYLAATDLNSKRPLLSRIRECGDYIKIICIDVVPQADDWRDRERKWIAWCRATYPNMVNVSAGGEGVLGLTHSEKTREKLRLLALGKPLSIEHRRKLSESLTGLPKSNEHVEKVRQSLIGKKASQETRRKLSSAHMGIKHTDETRAKISATLKRREVTPKQLSDLDRARSMRVFGPESREKMRKAKLGKPLSEEHKAKIRKAVLAHVDRVKSAPVNVDNQRAQCIVTP